MFHQGVKLCAGAALLTLAAAASAQDTEPLRILRQVHEFVVQTPQGPFTITRSKTACATDKGYIQPLVPLKGVRPVTEIEVLNALNDPSTMVIDMRDEDDPLDDTIPNSFHIPYNEIEDRLNELGCTRSKGKAARWNCSNAKKVILFCYGPMCLQSPTGIRRMAQMGFPVSKIFYYRGGLMDWEALGLTTVSGNRPTQHLLH